MVVLRALRLGVIEMETVLFRSGRFGGHGSKVYDDPKP